MPGMETRAERFGRALGRLSRDHPRSSKAALVFAACLGIAVWASYPPKELAIDNACMPDGFWRAVSEAVYGDKFWRPQIHAVITDLKRLEREPRVIAAANAQIEAQLQKSNAFLEEQYRQHPQLAPSPAQQHASQLRAHADTIEAAELDATVNALRARRIDWLIRCGAKLEQQHSDGK